MTDNKDFDISENAIIAYIDILGYSKLVQPFNLENASTMFKVLEKAISNQKYVSHLTRQIFKDNDHKEFFNKFDSAFEFRIISDTILLILDFSKLPTETPKDFEYEYDRFKNSIIIFFKKLSFFCLLFIRETGHILRGGIAFGKHFIKEKDNLLFIYSEAFIKGYNLEQYDKKNRKEKKDKPRARIILSQEFLEILEESLLNEYCCMDDDNKWCFNIYYLYKIYSKDDPQKCKKGLDDTVKAVTFNIKQNSDNEEVCGKLKYFTEHHNKFVKTLNLKETECCFPEI